MAIYTIIILIFNILLIVGSIGIAVFYVMERFKIKNKSKITIFTIFALMLLLDITWYPIYNYFGFNLTISNPQLIEIFGKNWNDIFVFDLFSTIIFAVMITVIAYATGYILYNKNKKIVK
jgi:hypothetical protein